MKFNSLISTKALCVWISVAMGIIWSSSTTFSGLAARFDEDVWKAHAEASDENTVQLALSLIWDGQAIKRHNIIAINQFRRTFHSVPVIHFISPAYFTRGDKKALLNADEIKKVIKPGDSIGLLLGGWKSFVIDSGAIFRNGPTFWGSHVKKCEISNDCGGDVPVHIYPDSDLKSFVKNGIEKLKGVGFEPPIAMMTDGFVSTPNVLAAATEFGIQMDFSAVSPSLIEKNMIGYPIFDWVTNLWPGIKMDSNPYVQPTGNSAITIVPNNLGAVDYHTSLDIEKIFKDYIASFAVHKSTNRTFNMAFHQSTAIHFTSRMMESLQAIFAQCVRNGIRITPLELPNARKNLVKSLRKENHPPEIPSH